MTGPAQGFSPDSDPFSVNPRVSARLRRGLLVGGVAIAVALAIPTLSGAQTPRHTKTVEVSERDFHITVPKRLPAGDVVIRLKNRGPEHHEFYVVRAGDGELPMRDDGLTVDEDAIEGRTAGVARGRHARQRSPPARAPASGSLRDVLQHVGPLPRRHGYRRRGEAVMRRSPTFRPLAMRGRRTVVAILVLFALLSAASIVLSTRATGRSKNRAAVVQVAARQRTLSERYVMDVLLKRAGLEADPAYTARTAEAERSASCSTAARRPRSTATTTRPRSPRRPIRWPAGS